MHWEMFSRARADLIDAEFQPMRCVTLTVGGSR
jgi:hypothetical protein